MLTSLLDEEDDRLTNVMKYERIEDQRDSQAGYYTRMLLTGAEEVELEVQRLRALNFEFAIIERFKLRETSVEGALVEMYLAGVSTKRIKYYHPVAVEHQNECRNSQQFEWKSL